MSTFCVPEHRIQLSAANCRGPIEAQTWPSPADFHACGYPRQIAAAPLKRTWDHYFSSCFRCYPRQIAAAPLKRDYGNSNKRPRANRYPRQIAAAPLKLIDKVLVGPAAWLSAANCRGPIEASTVIRPRSLDHVLSAANCRGPIEAPEVVPAHSVGSALSAANCRGPIEACTARIRAA